jgi:hypothetical protein
MLEYRGSSNDEPMVYLKRHTSVLILKKEGTTVCSQEKSHKRMTER